MIRRLVLGLILGSALVVVGYGYAEPLSTAFSYQCQLKQSGRPVTGLVDLKFALFDQAVEGNPVSPILAFEGTGGIDVKNGLCNVTLDWGANRFNGEGRSSQLSRNL